MTTTKTIITALVLGLALTGTGLTHAETSGKSTTASWIDDVGKVVWTATISPASGEPAGRLTAEPWRKPLPDFEVRLYGGSRVQLGEMKGVVLMINTWATWCEPCRHELPWLQQMYEAKADRGLVAIAVNVGERPIHTIPFAEEIGLSIPIGIYTSEMTPSLFPESVPSLLIADRNGRVRGRWNGFSPADTTKIEKLIDRVLGETGNEDERTEVAPVWSGAGGLEIRWMRTIPASVEDVRIVESEAGGLMILASQANLMATYDPDGVTVRQWASERGASKVRLAPGATAENPELVAFRPGGKQLVFIEGPGDEERATLEVESAIFDVVWLPAGIFGQDQALGLATLDGVRAITPDGEPLATRDGNGAASAIVGEPGSSERVSVLEEAGRLSRLGPAFEAVGESEVPPGSWSMLSAGGGAVAVASGDVFAMEYGDFLGDAGYELVLATRDGRLVILDALDGEIVFDSTWPALSGLAAADLDGDGVEEIVLGSKREIVVLARPDRGSD